MAWTLILSFQLQNKSQKGLSVDTPLDQLWSSYRLSKSRIEHLFRDARKWRYTCRYDTDGLVYTDYVRFAKDKINPITLDSDWACFQAEYVNVRGYDCSQCTIAVSQRSYFLLHMDTSSWIGCSLVPGNLPGCATNYGEDVFGYYGCASSEHRCASSPTSTTQMWFGGE